MGLSKLQNEKAIPMLAGLIGGTDVSYRASGDVTQQCVPRRKIKNGGSMSTTFRRRPCCSTDRRRQSTQMAPGAYNVVFRNVPAELPSRGLSSLFRSGSSCSPVGPRSTQLKTGVLKARLRHQNLGGGSSGTRPLGLSEGFELIPCVL